jgi:hypothetical protein
MEGTTAEVAKTGVEATEMAGGKRNKWLSHVKKTMKAHKGKSFKAVLKMAKKTYKGGAEGAADRTSMSPLPLSGGRRKTRKTKKSGRKH